MELVKRLRLNLKESAAENMMLRRQNKQLKQELEGFEKSFYLASDILDKNNLSDELKTRLEEAR